MEKRTIKKFAGAWKEIDDKEIEEIKEDIKNLRKSSTKELLNKTQTNFQKQINIKTIFPII